MFVSFPRLTVIARKLTICLCECLCHITLNPFALRFSNLCEGHTPSASKGSKGFFWHGQTGFKLLILFVASTKTYHLTHRNSQLAKGLCLNLSFLFFVLLVAMVQAIRRNVFLAFVNASHDLGNSGPLVLKILPPQCWL